MDLLQKRRRKGDLKHRHCSHLEFGSGNRPSSQTSTFGGCTKLCLWERRETWIR